jgi:hypothetical protein
MGKQKDDIEKVDGVVTTQKKEMDRDTRRTIKVIVKLILFTVLNILLSIGGLVLINLFVVPFISEYGNEGVWKILINDINNFRQSPYVKYCYACIGIWIYAALNEFVLIVRTYKKIDCIKNDECLSCQKYLKCRYRDIKVERGY